MEVTRDEYELPVVVADSAHELAKMIGVSFKTIKSVIHKHESGVLKTSKYVRVKREEREEI